MEMKGSTARRFWRELFTYEPGTRVRLKEWLHTDNPYIYIWGDSTTYRHSTELAKIPVEMFIGEIIKKIGKEGNFLIRWVADRRSGTQRPQCFIWFKDAFEIIEEENDED